MWRRCRAVARAEIGAIVRTDRVSFEGGQNARLPVTGAGVAYRIWRDVRLEGEVTMASGESRRSYEGDFISYAEPGSTREEFQRMAVIARRTTINKAGLGFATAVAVETRERGRVNLVLRAGISVRQYDYIETQRFFGFPKGGHSSRRVGHAGWSRTASAQRLLFGASVRSASPAAFTSRRKCDGCGEVRHGLATTTTKASSARGFSGSSDLEISYADFGGDVTPESLLGIGVGLALAAAAGFRVFVPLLVLSLAARTGWIELSPSFAWLATTSASVALGTAMVLEIAAYYVPFFDNMLDTLAAPVAVLAASWRARQS